MRIAPGSLWIAYTITSTSSVQKRLPPQLRLASSALLNEDRAAFPTPKLLFNVYRVESEWGMRGMRTEILTLGRHRKTRKLHFVILDCYTDTMQWDPVHGVRPGNACFFRPPHTHDDLKYAVGMKNSRDRLVVRGTRAASRTLTHKFAIESNLACFFQHAPTAYTMRFNESDVLQPVRDLSPVDITNTLWSDVRSRRPSHVFCHEREMTFDVDVPHFDTVR